MSLDDALAAFLDEQVVGALVTRAADGRVHQSLVYHVRDGDWLYISTVAERRKARDVRETGWASLCVMGHERPFPSVTVAGPAEILTEGIGPRTAAIAQRMMGLDEPPEPQTDAALAEVGRVLIAVEARAVGPASYITPG
jgi:PPOX class probable F420-dependent enzyme